jgi:hypothetical protein
MKKAFTRERKATHLQKHIEQKERDEKFAELMLNIIIAVSIMFCLLATAFNAGASK